MLGILATITVPLVNIVARFLFQHYQVNAVDNSFRSALHWATVLGKSKICTLLLESEARYDCQVSFHTNVS